MKIKLFIFAFIFVLFACISCAEEKREPDFRNVQWGMNKTDVINAEVSTKIVFDSDQNLEIEDTIEGNKFFISYKFDNKKLVMATYSLSDGPPFGEKAEKEFNKVFDMLKKEYGEPFVNERVWENRDGLYATTGKTSYPAEGVVGYCVWVFKRTQIELFFMPTIRVYTPSGFITKNNSEIRIVYREAPKEIQDIVKSQSRKKI